jgi:hypothetical protein
MKILATSSKRRGEQKSERTVPYPDIAWWVSTARASGGKDSELRRGPGSRLCIPDSEGGLLISVYLF